MADTPSYPITSGPEDEILSFTRFETDLTTGAIAKLIERVNVTQNTVSYIDADTGAAATPTGTVADKPLRVMVGSETVASNDLDGASASLAVPANANHAEIHVYDALGIVWTTSGTDPAGAAATGPTTGTRNAAGQTFELESKSELDNFAMHNLSTTTPVAGAGVYVEYFNFGDSWSGITD